MAGNDERFQKAMNQGHSAAWDQMWDQAAKFYRQALEEFPDHPKALASLGLALFEQQRYEEALQIYKRVVTVTPNDPLGLEKVAQICERMGRLNEAVQASLQAADLYIRQHNDEKAVVNWIRVTRFNPEHLMAHSRLAVAYENMGRKSEAVAEYLAVAALVQRPGDNSKAEQVVAHAIQLMPESKEARKALAMLHSSEPLPKPVRTKGGTGPMAMAQVRQMDASQAEDQAEVAQDPIAEARKKALIALAEILFESSEEVQEEQSTRRDLKTIEQGDAGMPPEKAERAMIVLHLGQAITAQTQGDDARAAFELQKSVEAGLNHPAAFFDLGYLQVQVGRFDQALRNLGHAVRHPEFTLASRLLMGQGYQRAHRFREAAIEYLEALRCADAATAPPDLADDLAQLYDPLIEAQAREKDDKVLESICANVLAQLLRPDWRAYLKRVREQLPTHADGGAAMPLAEMLLQTGSSQVVEALEEIRRLARKGCIRTAMEVAYDALQHAPTYLPLHVEIADLLLEEGRVEDAIEKLTVVSNTYNVRGEAGRSTALLRRVIALAPAEIPTRLRLIDQLVAQGQIDEAIQESINLADIYYRQAELEKARSTYMSALKLTQQSRDGRSWTLEILNRMADIDLQRLDWRQAIRVFEQIRTIQPGDEKAHATLIDLNFRMGQPQAALQVLDSYIVYLTSNSQAERAIEFLSGLVTERHDNPELHKRLSDLYKQVGRIPEAVKELDVAGDLLLNAGNRAGAIACVQSILKLKPADASEYQKLLNQLQSGE
jgi:tetratricopeptide (TPR) repeat protein